MLLLVVFTTCRSLLYDIQCDPVGSIFTKQFLMSSQEEVTTFKQARAVQPAYVPDEKGTRSAARLAPHANDESRVPVLIR